MPALMASGQTKLFEVTHLSEEKEVLNCSELFQVRKIRERERERDRETKRKKTDTGLRMTQIIFLNIAKKQNGTNPSSTCHWNWASQL